MIVFAFLPAFFINAQAAQVYASPPKETQQPLSEKSKTKRVDTKSSTRFVSLTDEIIVQFTKAALDIRNKKGVAKARTLATKQQMIVKSFLPSMNAMVVQSAKKETTEAAMKRLRTDPTVILVQKNFQTALKNNAIHK